MSDGADEVERWLAEQTEEVEATEPTITDRARQEPPTNPESAIQFVSVCSRRRYPPESINRQRHKSTSQWRDLGHARQNEACVEPGSYTIGQEPQTPNIAVGDAPGRLDLDSDHSPVRVFEDEIDLCAVAISEMAQCGRNGGPLQLLSQFHRNKTFQELAEWCVRIVDAIRSETHQVTGETTVSHDHFRAPDHLL